MLIAKTVIKVCFNNFIYLCISLVDFLLEGRAWEVEERRALSRRPLGKMDATPCRLAYVRCFRCSPENKVLLARTLSATLRTVSYKVPTSCKFIISTSILLVSES